MWQIPRSALKEPYEKGKTVPRDARSPENSTQCSRPISLTRNRLSEFVGIVIFRRSLFPNNKFQWIEQILSLRTDAVSFLSFPFLPFTSLVLCFFLLIFLPPPFFLSPLLLHFPFPSLPSPPLPFSLLPFSSLSFPSIPSLSFLFLLLPSYPTSIPTTLSPTFPSLPPPTTARTRSKLSMHTI